MKITIASDDDVVVDIIETSVSSVNVNLLLRIEDALVRASFTAKPVDPERKVSKPLP